MLKIFELVGEDYSGNEIKFLQPLPTHVCIEHQLPDFAKRTYMIKLDIDKEIAFVQNLENEIAMRFKNAREEYQFVEKEGGVRSQYFYVDMRVFQIVLSGMENLQSDLSSWQDRKFNDYDLAFLVKKVIELDGGENIENHKFLKDIIEYQFKRTKQYLLV